MKKLPRRFLTNRRTVLRGFGAAMALPFLESLAPRVARAQTVESQAPTLRFFGMYVPCGIHMQEWTPIADGHNFPLSNILRPLAPVKDYVTVCTGLDNYPASDQGDGAGGHARGTSTFLTQAHPLRGGLQSGISVDQVVANELGADHRIKSLEIGCERGQQAGECDSGYSCAYTQNISWANETTPNYKEVNPRLVFDRLFAGTTVTETKAQIQKRRAEDLSILDFVRGQTQALQPRLAVNDRHKLDQFFTGVRELENRIQSIDENAACPLAPPRPDGAALDTTGYAQSMLDLAALAFTCDITSVATFMLGHGASARAFPELGIASAHHELSHHQGRADKLGKLKTINTWEVELFAHFLQRLADTEEVDAQGEPVSMLHNSIAVMGSELADGDRHDWTSMPLCMAGRAGGTIDAGQHVRFAEGTPQANLYLTILNAMGIPATSFGDDGTDLLPQLLA